MAAEVCETCKGRRTFVLRYLDPETGAKISAVRPGEGVAGVLRRLPVGFISVVKPCPDCSAWKLVAKKASG